MFRDGNGYRAAVASTADFVGRLHEGNGVSLAHAQAEGAV
jgi:hypothetical protein